MSDDLWKETAGECVAERFDLSLEGLSHLEAQPQTALTFALIRELRRWMEWVEELESKVRLVVARIEAWRKEQE